MAKNDGSIVIDVDLNVDQAEKRLAKIKEAVDKTRQAITQKETDRNAIEGELQAAETAADHARSKIESLRDAVKDALHQKMDDSMETLAGWEAQAGAGSETHRQDMARAIKEQEALLRRQEQFLYKLEIRNYQFTETMREQAADLFGPDALSSIDALREQQTALDRSGKTAEKLRATHEKITREIRQQNDALTRQQSEEVKAQEKLAKAQSLEFVDEAVKRAEKPIARFTRTISNSLRRVFFFSLFYTGFRQIRDGLMQVVKTNEEAVAAIARLKGAFLTLVQPIIHVVIPAFVSLVNTIATAVEMFAELTAYLFGTTAQESAKAAEALYEEANGLNEIKDAAEEAEGSLASFDKINTIQTEPKTKKDDTIRPDFDAFDTNKFQTAFDRFRAMLTTGIAMLVIGAVLTFTGVNIPLGIGMMAAGAAMIYAAVALNWNSMDGPLKQKMAALMEIIGLSMVVLGVILLLTGHIPLGLALVVAGAYIFGAGVMAANWDAIDGTLNERLGELTKVIGTFLAVVGVILLLTGHVPLGVGLIVAGIALFKAGEIAAEWDSLGDTLDEKLWAVVETIAKYMLLFGVILLFIPTQRALGVGLIVAGAAILAAKEIAVNWDSLGGTIEEKIAGILDILKDYMLILGFILLFVPGFWPFGVGLITAGIAIMAAEQVALNWDSLGNTIEERIIGILDILKDYMLIVGFILLFVPGFRPLGVGLIIAGIAVLTTEQVALDWDGLGDTIEEKLVGILDIVKYYMLVLGFILLFVPGFRPFGLGLMTAGIGILTVQSLSDSYAMDEDLKGKLSILLHVLSSFMIVLGVILLFTGVLTPVAVALIGAGVGILGAGVIAPNWNLLLDHFRGLWTKIMSWWRTGPAQYFTSGYWLGKAREMIGGLIDGLNSRLREAGSWISNLFTGKGSTTVTIQGGSSARSSSSGTFSTTASTASYPAAIRDADVPALARGAVIPANREFLAVLGDQRNGRNLEAPESLLRQINQEGNAEIIAALARIVALLQQGQVIQVDGTTFGRTAQRTLNNITNASGKFALNW